MFQNPTEEFVFNLCHRSFLSLWTYANPLRIKDKKELCDVLAICEPHVLIFSVKNVAFDTQVDEDKALTRWSRKAIHDSAKQIYGAERNLTKAQCVTRSDGTKGLSLPAPNEKIVHRISVSLGGKGVVPIPSGDFGKGFVHVWEESFLSVVMKELDTISDFVGYLQAKETFAMKNSGLIIEGGEKNILAVFIHRGRKFPEETPPSIITGNQWDKLQQNEQFKLRNEANRESLLWDRLIEYLSREVLEDRMEFGGTLNDNERVLRYLARETRFARRILSNAFEEFLGEAKAGVVEARMTVSPSGVAYVFFAPPVNYPRDARIVELGNRCFVARNELPDCETVIGIGTNIDPAPRGFATDLYLVSVPTWTDKHRSHAENMKQELGYFREPRVTGEGVDEFPKRNQK
jgi:hypothetical protein